MAQASYRERAESLANELGQERGQAGYDLEAVLVDVEKEMFVAGLDTSRVYDADKPEDVIQRALTILKEWWS